MKEKEPQFLIGIEWDPNPNCDIDFDYWCDDDLEYLLKRFISAKNAAFDTSIGSCPNLQIKKAIDVRNQKEYSLDEISLMIMEIKSKRINNGDTI